MSYQPKEILCYSTNNTDDAMIYGNSNLIICGYSRILSLFSASDHASQFGRYMIKGIYQDSL
jgi:hypothetical protein